MELKSGDTGCNYQICSRGCFAVTGFGGCIVASPDQTQKRASIYMQAFGVYENLVAQDIKALLAA